MTKRKTKVVVDESIEGQPEEQLMESDGCPVLAANIRKQMYDELGIVASVDVLEEPDEQPQVLLLDYTFDVTNTTIITHGKIDAVKALLDKADGIVVDSEQLAHLMGQFTETKVVVARYGKLNYIKNKSNKTPLVGILNYGTYAISSAVARDMLKSLDVPLLCYGTVVDGIECEVAKDFVEFARRVDILLCPSSEIICHQVTPVLSAMSVGTAVILSATGPFTQFGASVANGVTSIHGNDQEKWIKALAFLKQSKNLEIAQADAVTYAEGVSISGSKIAQAFHARLKRRIS